MLRSALFCLVTLSTCLSLSSQAQQVTPDGTLNTGVTRSNNLFSITGGTTAGTNLFHSFDQFSIPTGGSATFNHSATIQNIFSRVTGGTISNIDGMIQTNGSANLFLLNPNGILFGANARLNLGGSFIGTTAQAIKFANGTEFSSNVQTPPLLTMSAPVGLQFGTRATAIELRGSHLQVPIGQTIGLIGGAMQFENARITAPDGQIELGSIAANQAIELIPTDSNWRLNYAPNLLFQPIQLRKGSAIEVSGNSGGRIQVRSQHLTLTEGSQIVSRTFGTGTGGLIDVQASDSITILGAGAGELAAVTSAPDFIAGFDFQTNAPQFSGIYSTVMQGATGRGSNIRIETKQLQVRDGFVRADLTTYLSNSTINATTLGSGQGGNIAIKADRLYLTEQSTIFTLTGIWLKILETGNAGNLTVDANSVIVQDGGLLTATTEGNGDAGNLTIRATEQIHLEATPTNFTTVIESSSYGRGRAGNLTLETGTLKVLNGGRLASSSDTFSAAGNIDIRARDIVLAGETSVPSDNPFTWFDWHRNGISAYTISPGAAGTISIVTQRLLVQDGSAIRVGSGSSGNSGSITIQADEVALVGTDSTGIDRSGIFASSLVLVNPDDPTLQSSGRAGSVTIDANRLYLRDRAEISATSQGEGDAGNLNLTANQIWLTGGSSLLAESNAGTQGNIRLDTQALILRQGSNIRTNAQNTANGGNITIAAPIILGLEDSNIVANAVQGRGGDISITTQGIVGLKYRDRLTPENDITASSEVGLNGTVEVNNTGVDPNAGLTELSAEVIDSTQQIAKGCDTNQSSSFVITGRGGIPINPIEKISRDRTWNDLRSFSASGQPASPTSISPLVEATTWQRNAQTGKVELIAGQTGLGNAIATCAPS